jgi:alkylhydroperoxidase family enzyme
MARISLTPKPSFALRAGSWYAKRRFGAVMQPAQAMGHHPAVLRSAVIWESQVERWNKLDEHLKGLAVLASAVSLNCSWCMDFGYWVLHTKGIPEEKLRAVLNWRESDVFTPLERLVMEYAEAASATPVAVTDELVEQLRQHLDEAQIVELAMMVAVENQRSRFNAALGLHSQGFSDRCAVRA